MSESDDGRQHNPLPRYYAYQQSPPALENEEGIPLLQHSKARRLVTPRQTVTRSDATNNSSHNNASSSSHYNTIAESARFFLAMSSRWFPNPTEQDDTDPSRVEGRSMRRRVFLFLTEPTTSFGSAVFFVILILAIALSNILMIMQTMTAYQFTPTDCRSCGGPTVYSFEDDTVVVPIDSAVPCVCPPTPIASIVRWEDYVVYFFTVEWTLRVIMFEPPLHEQSSTFWGRFCQWLSFLCETTTIMDSLAIFPYYAERFEQTNGLMSLRLVRLFRVFQLVRLGQYNTTFMSLRNVLGKATTYFKLLIIVLLFGAAFFGSMIYWLEKGEWEYNEELGTYMYMRTGLDGISREPSPFTSIPSSFFWFLVTATTVGYGDTYPTSTGGKFVASLTMLAGVLVIAFPVSVFSDLWSKELKNTGAIDELAQSKADNNAISKQPPHGNTVEILGVPSDQAHERKQQHLQAKDAVVLRAEDVATIRSHLKTIDDCQFRIRRILLKYDVDA